MEKSKNLLKKPAKNYLKANLANLSINQKISNKTPKQKKVILNSPLNKSEYDQLRKKIKEDNSNEYSDSSSCPNQNEDFDYHYDKYFFSSDEEKVDNKAFKQFRDERIFQSKNCEFETTRNNKEEKIIFKKEKFLKEKNLKKKALAYNKINSNENSGSLTINSRLDMIMKKKNYSQQEESNKSNSTPNSLDDMKKQKKLSNLNINDKNKKDLFESMNIDKNEEYLTLFIKTPSRSKENSQENSKMSKNKKQNSTLVSNFPTNFNKQTLFKDSPKKIGNENSLKIRENSSNPLLSTRYSGKSKSIKIDKGKNYSHKKSKSKLITNHKNNPINNLAANLNIEEIRKNYNSITNEYYFEFKYLDKNRKIFNHLPGNSNIASQKYCIMQSLISPVNCSTIVSQKNFNFDENNEFNLNTNKNNFNSNSFQSPKSIGNLQSNPLSNSRNNTNEIQPKGAFYIKSLFKSKPETLFVLNFNNTIFKNTNYEMYLKNLNQFQNFFIKKYLNDPKDIVYVKAYKDAPKCIIVPVEHSGSKFSKNLKRCNLIWKLYKFDKMVNFIKSLTPSQKYNHFPKTFQLGRKDNLWKNFKKFNRKYPLHYNYHPQAFIIPEELSEFKHFSKTNPSFAWIIKPQASSRGRGIRLLTSNEDIPKECLICRYIEKPHLINNKKYDLRIYVLITSFTPLKIFLFKDGLVRFASEEYTKGNKENIFIHLTNYAVNKKNKNYDKTDDDGSGSKWTITAYEKYFIENNLHDKFMFIWERIKDIVIKTLITSAEESANYSKACSKYENVLFELYGFDIMVDQDFNPWLLEVNVNPSLNCDSELDYNVKTNLITDIINIIGLRPFEEDLNNDNCVKGNGSQVTNSPAAGRSKSIVGSESNIRKSYIGNNLNKNKQNNNYENTHINNNQILPVIKNNGNPSKNIQNFNYYNDFNTVSISQVRIENRRNFKKEEPDFGFNYNEEIVKNYYQNFLKTYEDEYFRSKFTNFDCIFPLSNNCKNYFKFFKSFDDESIVLWKWIISKKPIDKFD